MSPWAWSWSVSHFADRRLRGAVIGVGNVVIDGHLPGWAGVESATIVAATDADPARRARLGAALPEARWYPTVDALLDAERLDFVDICTPPASHAQLIETAFGRGLHVLCEKPLVCDPGDLVRLGRRARELGRILHTVHNWRYAPIVQAIEKVIREGAMGKLQRCRWETLRTRPAGVGSAQDSVWRIDPKIAGGGILIDHGWHALYVVAGWVDQIPARVSARLETRRHHQWPVEDTATVHLEFPSVEAEIFLTWAATRRANRIFLEGSAGSLQVDDGTLVLKPAGDARGGRRWEVDPPLSAGSYHRDWFAGVAQDFVCSCTTGTDDNFVEAGQCATLIALAQASSRRSGASLAVAGDPD